jgi:hypothetical protein
MLLPVIMAGGPVVASGRCLVSFIQNSSSDCMGRTQCCRKPFPGSQALKFMNRWLSVTKSIVSWWRTAASAQQAVEEYYS